MQGGAIQRQDEEEVEAKHLQRQDEEEVEAKHLQREVKAKHLEYFCDVENRESKEIVSGVRIRTFWGDNMLSSIVDLDVNAVVPAHTHPHEQTGAVISGKFEMTIDGETRIIPGGVEHGGRTGDTPAKILDVFSPVRESYQY